MILYNILYPCLDAYGVPYRDEDGQFTEWAILSRVVDRDSCIQSMNRIIDICHESPFFDYPEHDYYIPPRDSVFEFDEVHKPDAKHAFEFNSMTKVFICQDNGDHGTAYCTTCRVVFPWDVTIEEGLDWDETRNSLVLACPNKHFDK